MDKLKNGKVNNGTTEYGLTEQMNTGSKLCKPPLERSEDGLLCVRGVKGGEWRAESPEGSFLPLDLLREGAGELGIELSDDQLSQMDLFARLLVETNKTLNLTRITDPTEIVTGHYLDSFTCLAAAKIKKNARVIDIGTGAGFPGIPIKIARPDLDMNLLDSSLKKLKFVEGAVDAINTCSGGSPWPPERDDDAATGRHGDRPLRVTALHARAEEAGRDASHREAYDVAFARALADMRVLAELALPLVEVGGMLVAQKSEGADEEIYSARALIGQLGGKIEQIKRIAIPGTEITRHLVVISKIKTTPPQFPRSYARISSSRR